MSAQKPNLGDRDCIAIYAFRYCLGRMTYAVSDCTEWLVSQWQSLDEHAKAIIRRDLEEAIKADDEDRKEGQTAKRLGMDMDRREWERVRKLWSAP